MINKLGNYRGVSIYVDDTLERKEILCGYKPKEGYIQGKNFSPLKEFKEKKNLTEEETKKYFRSPQKNDYKKERVINWMVGGEDKLQIYKGAIDKVYNEFGS